MSDLYKELSEINRNINKLNEEYNLNNIEFIKVETILEKKKGEVKLRDIIESEGKRELQKVFSENIEDLKSQIFEMSFKIKKLNDKLKQLVDKKRRENILSDYRSFIKKNLNELNVYSITDEDLKKINATIQETGNTTPRTLLAYYFAILKVIRKYGSSTFCPIIIDSPNQQAQDKGNINSIYKFILNSQPENSQLILGTEDLFEIDFDCPIIEFTEKLSMLQEDEYDEVSEQIQPFLEKIWNGNRLF